MIRYLREGTMMQTGQPHPGDSDISGVAAVSPESNLVALVLERVSDAFVALDRDWRYTYVNRQAAAILGKRADEILGCQIWAEDEAHADEVFQEAYRRAMDTQQFVFVEAYYPPFDRWFENRIYPSPDGVSVFFHDITDRKRAEMLLRGQMSVLERIANGAPLAEALSELLRVIEANSRPGTLCSILLLDADGVRLRHGAAPSLPDSFTRPIDGSSMGPRAGSCGTAAYRRETVVVEDIATDPLWADYRALALPHGLRACWSTPIFDDKRQLLGTFAMYHREPGRPNERDQRLIDMAAHIAAIAITRERAENERRQSERRYRSLVESNVIGVIIVDTAGRVVEANDAVLRMIGYSRDELASLRWGTLRATGGSAADPFARIGDSGVCPPLEEELIHKQGHRVPVRVTAALLAGSGSDAICLVEDVAERKEQERIRQQNVELEEANRAALEANRLKSEFLANMSHELRTPLNAILGFSEFLSDQTPGPLNTKQSECLGHVLTSAHHLLRLINDVLDLAKVEAGRLDLYPEEFELCEVLEEVCSVARAIGQTKSITVQHTCDKELSPVRLDPQKLKQVLFNLLANAVKFTECGGHVDVEAHMLDRTRIEIKVHDNGIGIDQHDLPKLFQAFRQLDGGAARRHEGTGLGLALVKRLVESQNGSISVESRLGQGSTFSVVLPRMLA
jgi:PAS domain S-box-containing protein